MADCACREHAPSIIFMDEVDSIGSARMEGGSGGGDSEVQRTMLELLNQLDGFEATNKIKVTAHLSPSQFHKDQARASTEPSEDWVDWHHWKHWQCILSEGVSHYLLPWTGSDGNKSDRYPRCCAVEARQNRQED